MATVPHIPLERDGGARRRGYDRAMRLPARPHPAPADVVACVLLTVAGGAISLDPEAPSVWLDTATMPALTVPLLWRRTAPLGCCAALAAGAVLSGLPTFSARVTTGGRAAG